MCFSFEVSISTFLFSWAASIYLLTKSLSKLQRDNVIFLMIFSTMQLADAILWWNNMKQNQLNYIITSLAIPLILSAQVLFNAYIRNSGKYAWLNTLAITLSIYLFIKLNGYSKSVCDGWLSSPIWGSSEFSYWELLIFLLAIMYPTWKAIGVTALIMLPLIYAIARGGYGSLWCALANILAIKYLIKY